MFVVIFISLFQIHCHNIIIFVIHLAPILDFSVLNKVVNEIKRITKAHVPALNRTERSTHEIQCTIANFSCNLNHMMLAEGVWLGLS